VRELAATAIAGVAATVVEERAARGNENVRPLVVVTARSEAVDTGDGTMGQPVDRRTLQLVFEITTDGATGVEAVDAANALDEAIGVALGVALDDGGILDGELFDLRFAGIEIEVNAEQERYLVAAAITYAAQYDLYFGDPT
jgi:hypothetical protein